MCVFSSHQHRSLLLQLSRMHFLVLGFTHSLSTLYPLFIPQEQQLSVTAAFTSAQYGAIKLCTCLCLGLKLNTFVVEQITIDFEKKRQATIQCYCNNQVFTGIRVFLPSFRLIFRFPNKLPVYWLSARATRPERLKDKVKRLLGGTSSIHFRGGISKKDTLLQF